MAVWVSVGKGIRYREHESRKHGQRPDRYWCIRYKVDGREVNESVGWWSSGATKARCEEILTVLRQNHRLGHGPQTFREMKENERQRDEDAALVVDDENEMTLSALWPGYIEWLSLSAKRSTIRTTVSYRQTWFTQLADRVFGDITTADLEKMIVAPMIKAGKSPGTIERALGMFSSMWGWAKREGLVDGPNPKSKVKRPLEDNKRDRFLSRDEAVLLLKALKDKSSVTHDMALLSLFCGLRAGECLRLTWADVDFDNGLLFIKTSKNQISRHAYITAEVREMLFERFQGQPKPAKVFTGPQGDESYCQISTHFRDTVKALGFNNGIGDRRQKVVFHTLRHTFASWLAQKGKPIYTVGKLMGHKAIKHTERYAHLAPKEQREAAARLEGFLKF